MHARSRGTRLLTTVVATIGIALGMTVTAPTGPAAAVVADTTAPPAPRITVTKNDNHLQISWSAVSDPSGIAQYRLARDGVSRFNGKTSIFDDSPPLVPGTTLTYSVQAVDGAGNVSPAGVLQYVVPKPTTIPPPLPAPVAKPSGLDGAGFQNVLDVDPFDQNNIIVGGDVAGVHWSNDKGATFHGGNEGLYSNGLLHVADVAYSPTVRNKAYAGSGIKGGSGGFAVSTDGGKSWVVRSTVPQFASDNAQGTGLPSPHPRSTGNLIAIGDGVLYAATYNDGLMRSKDDGATWTTLGLNGKFLRGLVLDPSNPDVLYVASYNDGVWVTTTARGAGTFTKLAGPPTTPEELALVGGVLWLAAGPNGVWKATGSGSSRTWSKISTAQLPQDGTATKWQSITGYKPASGSPVLYTGNVNGTDVPTQAGQINTIYRSTDGGTTWKSVTADRPKISFNVNNGTETWWLLAENGSFGLGRGQGVASQIVIDPNNPNRIYSPGRSGVWRSDDTGNTWFPIVAGLGATIPRGVAVEDNGQNVYVAIADWVLVQSQDGGKSFTQNQPPGGNVGYGVAVDKGTTPNTVYVGVGERDNAAVDGEVFRNPNPTGGGSWVSEHLEAVTGGKRVINVATYRINGDLILLAVVEAGGVWRKVGTNGNWVRAQGDQASTSPGRNTPQFALASDNIIYFYDQSKGLYRSSNAGQSFSKIWAQPASGQLFGYIAADPVNPGRVYVSQGKTTYRLDGAHTGSVSSGVKATDLKVPNPGPPFVSANGYVWVPRQPTKSAGAALLRSADAGATWVEVIDPEWARNGGLVTDTMFGGTADNPDDARVIAGFDGTGVLVFEWGGQEPPVVENPDLAPSTLIASPVPEQQFGDGAVTVSGSATDDVGVSGVTVSLQNRVSKQWLQANGSFGATFASLPATVATPGAKSTSWNLPVDLPPGDYTVNAIATDTKDQDDGTDHWTRFSVSAVVNNPPNTVIDQPADGAVLPPATRAIAGTATDDKGVTAVSIQAKNTGSGLWLQQNGTFGANPFTFAATVLSPGATSTEWVFTNTLGFTVPEGSYAIHAFATDGAGLKDPTPDVNSVKIGSPPGPQNVVGSDTATVSSGGVVHIFYRDATSKDLRHAYGSGTSWSREVLDGNGGDGGRISGDVGTDVSAVVQNGVIHVFYRAVGNGNLRHAAWSGSAWTFATLDGASTSGGRVDADVGVGSSAFVFNNAVNVTYFNATAGDLRRAVLNGSAWTFETLDGAGGADGRTANVVGRTSTAAVASNQLFLWYRDDTAKDLRLARMSGSTWSFSTLDGNGGGRGRTTNDVASVASGAALGAEPHVWYYDATGGDLRHGWRNTSNEWTFETVDGASTSGGRVNANVGTSIAAVTSGTTTAVLYRDETGGNLRNAFFNGTAWSFSTLDGAGAATGAPPGRINANVGAGVAATVLNLVPYVAYGDATNGDLRLAMGPLPGSYQTVDTGTVP